MNKEESMLQKRLVELSRLAYNRGIVIFSVFLNLNELNILHTTPKDMFLSQYKTYGGYDLSERQMAVFLPDALYYDYEYPIQIIEVTPSSKRFAEDLTHRDYLGALMNLGIERSKVGDIIVQGTVGDKENTYIKAVVGKVVEVGYNWSKVSSLVDSASNVSFNVVRTQSYGAINGQENNLLSGFMYKSDADVVVGDKLVTSGRGGVFPRNLYIGEVTEVKSSENNLEKKVSVKSPVDFTTLFRVFVLKGNGEDNE